MAAVEPIIVHILGDATELSGALATAGSEIKAFGTSMVAMGTGLTALVTVPIVGVAAAALLSANNVQKAYAIIIAGTGATGDKLTGLEKQFDDLASTIPNSFTDTATVLTTVNDKLQQGGYNITQISHDILDVSRMTGESATTLASDFTAAIQQWKVSAADTSNFMNTVYSTAQAARVPVTQILTDLDTYGPTIRAANIPLNDAIPIIGDIESKGEDATRTFQGMAYAWANVAKMIADPSKTTQKAVDDITLSAKNAGISLTSTGNDVQAVFAGIKAGTISDADAAAIFGSRFGANITQMIRDGTISAKDFIAMTNGMAINIEDVGKRSITFAQALDTVKNALEVALNPLGEKMISVFEQLLPIVTGAIGIIGHLADIFGALPMPVADVVFGIAAFAAGLGPALILTGTLIRSLGDVAKGMSAIISVAANLASAVSSGISGAAAAIGGGVGSATDTAALTAQTAATDAATLSAAEYAASLTAAADANTVAAAAATTFNASITAAAIDEEGVTAANLANVLTTEELGVANLTTAGATDVAAASEDVLAASAVAADVAIGGGLLATLISMLPILILVGAGIAAVVAVLAVFAAGLYLAYESSATLRTTIGEVGAAFGTFGSEMMSGLGLILNGDYKGAFDDFQKAFTDLWKGLVVIDWDNIGQTIDTEIKQGIAAHRSEIMHALDGFEADAIKFFQGVDWGSVGTVVGEAMGNMLSIALSGATTALSGAQSSGVVAPPGVSQTVSPSDVTASNEKLAQGSSGLAYNAQGQLTGAMESTDLTSKLEQVGEAAAGAFVKGFEKGITDGMKNVRWGDLIWGIINTDLSTGQQTQGGFDPGNSPLKHWVDQIGTWWDNINWGQIIWGGINTDLSTGQQTQWGFDPGHSPLAGWVTQIGSWWDHINWGGIFNWTNAQNAITGGLGTLASGLGHLFDPITTPINNFLTWWNGLHFGPISLPSIVLPDMNPIQILEEALTTITSIPSDDITLTLNIAGVGMSVLQTLWDALQWIVGHFSAHEIELDIAIPGADLLEKVYGDLVYIVGHSAVVTTLKAEADDLIGKWNALGFDAKVGPWGPYGGEHEGMGPWGPYGGEHEGMGPWGPYGGQSESMGPWGPYGGQGVNAGPWEIPAVSFTAPSLHIPDPRPAVAGGGSGWDVGGQTFGGGPWSIPQFNFNLPQITVPQFGFNLPQFSVPALGFDLPQFTVPSFGFDLPQFSVPGFELGWKAPQLPMLGTGAVIGPRAGGFAAILAEEGKPEVVVPWEDVGKPWDEVLNGLPRLAQGGIIGSVQQMPNVSSSVDNFVDAIKSMRQSPMYQVNATIDAEAIKRDIMQAILELEQFHHLGNMG